MRYIIMANGKGSRWGNFGGVSKQMIQVDGETLLQRTVRLLLEIDPASEVIISSSNPDYEVEGAVRFEPPRNDFEIDRFCIELCEGDFCFLFGDVFYSLESLRSIADAPVDEFLFMGSESSIYAVKSVGSTKLRETLVDLRSSIVSGEIPDGKGWQLYHALVGLPLPGHEVSSHYVYIRDITRDFNTPEDYLAFTASGQC